MLQEHIFGGLSNIDNPFPRCERPSALPLGCQNQDGSETDRFFSISRTNPWRLSNDNKYPPLLQNVAPLSEGQSQHGHLRRENVSSP